MFDPACMLFWVARVLAPGMKRDWFSYFETQGPNTPCSSCDLESKFGFVTTSPTACLQITPQTPKCVWIQIITKLSGVPNPPPSYTTPPSESRTPVGVVYGGGHHIECPKQHNGHFFPSARRVERSYIGAGSHKGWGDALKSEPPRGTVTSHIQAPTHGSHQSAPRRQNAN